MSWSPLDHSSHSRPVVAGVVASHRISRGPVGVGRLEWVPVAKEAVDALHSSFVVVVVEFPEAPFARQSLEPLAWELLWHADADDSVAGSCIDALNCPLVVVQLNAGEVLQDSFVVVVAAFLWEYPAKDN